MHPQTASIYSLLRAYVIYTIPFYIADFPYSYKNKQQFQISLGKGWSKFFGRQGNINTSVHLRKKIHLRQENNIRLFLIRFIFWALIVIFTLYHIIQS